MLKASRWILMVLAFLLNLPEEQEEAGWGQM